MDFLARAALSNAMLVSLLAVIVLAVDRFARRPALSHSLWLLLLVKLITPPLLPFSFNLPTASPRLQPAPVPIADTSRIPWAPALGPPVKAMERAAGLEPTTSYSGLARGFASTTTFMSRRALLEWRTAILCLWLTGSGLWLIWTLVRLFRLGRCFDLAPSAPSNVQELARNIARSLGLKRCPRVWFIPGTSSPALWTFGLQPRLLIPEDLWVRLGEDQRALLLAHELAHFRRGDHLVRGLEFLVIAFYWWFPVVWCMRRSLQEAEEQCCDAWVLWALPGTASAYARTLLDTVDFLADGDGTVPLAGSGMGSVGTLKLRLSSIMRGTSHRALSRAGSIGVLGMAGIVLPLALHQEQTRGFPRGYHVIDLGPYRPTAINNSGQIVGNQLTAVAENRWRSRAYRWDRGRWSDLGNLVGMSSVALDINDLGQVTGWYNIPDREWVANGKGARARVFGMLRAMDHSLESVDANAEKSRAKAFRTDPNRPINPQTDDLGTLGGEESIGTAINILGQVVGVSSRSGMLVGFRTRPNRPIDPDTDDLCKLGVQLNPEEGLAINSQGEVVGKMSTGPNVTRSFRTGPDRPIDPVTDDLGPKEKPDADVRVHTINDRGQVVGTVIDPQGQPFLGLFSFCTASHQHIDMNKDELRDAMHPRLINNDGLILGTSPIPLAGVPHVQWALHDGKTTYLLPDLIPPDSGWLIEMPMDINDRGQIVGEGINPQKEASGFLLEPVPDPSPLYWLMAGTLLTSLGWSIRGIGTKH